MSVGFENPFFFLGLSFCFSTICLMYPLGIPWSPSFWECTAWQARSCSLWSSSPKNNKDRDIEGLVMHYSNQGWHYQHMIYQKMLKAYGIIQSMSRKRNCLDNAMMENFFGLIKNELLYVNLFESIEEFERELKKYIWWYNNKRIKQRLKGRSPATCRAHYYRDW